MVNREVIEKALKKPFKGFASSQSKVLSGKVRDWYSLPSKRRLLVTTDRLSAFDRNLGFVPWKGQVLNQLSAWWNEKTQDIVPNHLISLPDPNASLVHEVAPIPVEVIVRGYITGVTETALWYRYSLGERNIYGYNFPEQLVKNQKLPHPIITPTTKGGATGHDERLTRSEIVEKGILEPQVWKKIEDTAFALFERGQKLAEKAGLILVDTKYEFGLDDEGRLILIDEIHTPDSSRFWKKSSYEDRLSKGLEPESFDKEFIRLEYVKIGYRGDGEIPQMSEELWVTASLFYQSAFEMLTGNVFFPEEYPVEPRLMRNLKKEGISV